MTAIVEGQKVYLKPIGNNARHNDTISEGIIISIKNKYFYVVRNDMSSFQIKIRLDNFTEFGDFSNWKVYTSLQEIEDEKEAKKLISEFRELFMYNPRLPLYKLRGIKKIIMEEMKNER